MGYVRCFNDDGSECPGYHEKEEEKFEDSGADATDKSIARLEMQQSQEEYIQSLCSNDDEFFEQEYLSCIHFVTIACEKYDDCKDCPLSL